jgi:hypothetical protein
MNLVTSKINVRLYLGGDNDRAGQAFPLTKVVQVVQKYTSGATFYEGYGVWNGVLEDSWVIELFAYPEKDLKPLCQDLCKAFNQEAIAWSNIGDAGLIKST